MLTKTIVAAGIALSTAPMVLADFQYHETTTITGGLAAGMMKLAGAFSKTAREPIVTDVYVKGNRMAHISQHHGSVIDLGAGTITEIDFDKKQYSVMTFEEMQQRMQDAMKQAQQSQDKREAKNPDAQLNFKAAVRETGQSKPVGSVTGKEFVMTLMMEGTDTKSGQSGSFGITNDMWMAKDIPGYDEVREFQKKMALRMAGMMGDMGVNFSQLGRPEAMKGMQEMAKEVAKLKGIPVLQVMRMGTTADGKPLPPASEAPDAAKVDSPDVKGAAGRATGDAAAGSLENRLGKLGGLAGGIGGGLGGMRRKKQQDEQKQAEQDKPSGQPAQAILMESTTEMTGFSSGSVDGSKLEAPSGFKKVDAPAMGRGRR